MSIAFDFNEAMDLLLFTVWFLMLLLFEHPLESSISSFDS